MRVYEEIIDFLAAGITPQDLIRFRPSEQARTYVAELIHRKNTTGLSAEENSELAHYLELEHIMRLAKARARQNLANGAMG